ncbi:MAG: two-component sensor histidine kinase [Crocinitomicaceae bacterium]|nr:two-component sensor histidine kinase [Crocinitomicaceae bacterium]
MKKRRNPSFWLYAIGSYILLQFFWWAWLLVDQPDGGDINRRLMMVVGEGAVFLLLLILGFKKLQKSIEREVQIAHSQRNFLLSVTHELNTPLATIKLYLQTLVKRDLNKEQSSEILSNSIAETDRLKGLVDNILTSARIEENQMVLHCAKHDLGSLVVDFVNPKLNHELSDRIKLNIEKNVFCEVDPLAIQSILQNLLSNAIKYDPKKSSIEFEVKSMEDWAVLLIKDQGIGVPDGQSLAIFRKFYRVQSEQTRSTKGTGLGLYIVNNLVSLQNGEIQHLPNSPAGSIFEIKFPLVP